MGGRGREMLPPQACPIKQHGVGNKGANGLGPLFGENPNNSDFKTKCLIGLGALPNSPEKESRFCRRAVGRGSGN